MKNINNIIKSILLLSAVIFISACGKNVGDPSVITYSPITGPPGTLVTVEGMNFDDLTKLNFDDEVPADFNPSFGTPDVLLFRVPEDAPLGDNMIHIETEHGETFFPFKVTLEAPVVSDFYPKSANEGETVTILGTNFFEPLEILFFDSIPGKILYHQPDSLVIEVPAGVERGRINVKANGGNSLTAELFFSTVDYLVNDFDGNGLRAETNKWLFYGNIEQNFTNAVHNSNPDPLDGNFLKVSGTDPGSIWIGGTESHSNDPNDFDVFPIASDINNTFVEMDINNNGAVATQLIIVLAERNGSTNDFTAEIDVDWEGWRTVSIPLSRFADIGGVTIDPSKIRTIKMHLYNGNNSSNKLEVNIDNLKFVQIN